MGDVVSTICNVGANLLTLVAPYCGSYTPLAYAAAGLLKVVAEVYGSPAAIPKRIYDEITNFPEHRRKKHNHLCQTLLGNYNFFSW